MSCYSYRCCYFPVASDVDEKNVICHTTLNSAGDALTHVGIR